MSHHKAELPGKSRTPFRVLLFIIIPLLTNLFHNSAFASGSMALFGPRVEAIKEAPKVINDLINYKFDRSDKKERKRLKLSVASVSKSLLKLSASKRVLADSINSLPEENIKGLNNIQRDLMQHSLMEIDAEIKNLAKLLDNIDPQWSARNQKFRNTKFYLTSSKNFEWNVRAGPVSIHGLRLREFQIWLREEAEKLSKAAEEITEKLEKSQ